MSDRGEQGKGVQVPPGVATCPYVGGVAFDPMDVAQVLEPYPWLEAARRESPVFYMPEYDEWWVTRYDDVLEVLRDTTTFSSRHTIDPRPNAELEAALPNGHPLAAGLVNTDPPEHTRLRKFAQVAFTPKIIASREEKIRAISNKLIDAFIDQGQANIPVQYSRELAGAAVTVVIGADESKTADFLEWSDIALMSITAAPPLDPETEKWMAGRVKVFNAWIHDFIQDRRDNPRDDYTSLLLHGDGGRQPLSTWEIVRILTNVVGAGVDTTSSLINFSLYELLRQPERWRRVVENPELIPAVVEEMCRFVTPVRGVRRDVLADTTIGGVPVPEGAVINLSYTSAQRDEEIFEHAGEYDVDRTDAGLHYTFGKGRHFCLGALLARLETKLTLEAFAERLPGLVLPDGEKPQVMPSRLGAFVTGFSLEWPAVAVPA